MNIREYRKLKGLTQAAFGDLIGVSSGLIGQFERGETSITGQRAKDIHRETDGLVPKWESCPDLWEPPGELPQARPEAA